MARHRSPQGRRAIDHPPPVALHRTVAGGIARRSLPTPLLRGAAAVAVTGGAFSLIAAATSAPVTADTAVVAAAQSRSAAVDDDALRPVVEPVHTHDGSEPPAALDAAGLVKAVQLAERETTDGDADPGDEQGDDAQDGNAQGGNAEDRDAEDRDDREDGSADEDADRDAPEEEQGDGRDTAGRHRADDAPDRTGSAGCGIDTAGLGAVKAHVRRAAEFIGCRFGEPTMYGVAGRGGTSDHPSGKAIDFMVDRRTGDALARCALANKDALGVTYVIWRQRMNDGSGWSPMEDRGGVTANHFDHVHVSFGSSAGGAPKSC